MDRSVPGTPRYLEADYPAAALGKKYKLLQLMRDPLITGCHSQNRLILFSAVYGLDVLGS